MDEKCDACVIGLIRPEIRQFAIQMNHKLSNRYPRRPDFPDSWRNFPLKDIDMGEFSFNHLISEMLKLFSDIHENKPPDEVTKEAADMANILMFIAYNYKKQYRSERQQVEDEIRAGYIADRIGGE